MTATLTVKVPHRLTREQALARMRNNTPKIARRGGRLVTSVRYSWSGDTLVVDVSALGQSATAQIAVNDIDVTADMDLPVVAMLQKGMVKKQARKALTRLLA